MLSRIASLKKLETLRKSCCSNVTDVLPCEFVKTGLHLSHCLRNIPWQILIFREGPSINYVRKIFRKKTTFLTPRYADVRVRIRGLEMLILWKILRTYLMDGPGTAF